MRSLWISLTSLKRYVAQIPNLLIFRDVELVQVLSVLGLSSRTLEHRAVALLKYDYDYYFCCARSSLLHELSLAVASGGYFLVSVHWALITVASLVVGLGH